MILSDTDIFIAIEQKQLVISPLKAKDVQPASIDLHLSRTLLFPCDKCVCGKMLSYHLYKDAQVELKPKEFILASTTEHVEIPATMAAQVAGKSSLARLGLSIHQTAGWVDPGFKGTLTLELFNASNMPIKLRLGMPIAQLVLHRVVTESTQPYGHAGRENHYQNQKDTTQAHTEIGAQ